MTESAPSMTDAQALAELKAAAEKATPGPWRMFVPDRGYCATYVLTDDPAFAPVTDKEPCKHLVADCDDCTMGERNAAFIALANPANLLALTAYVEAQQERIAELEKGLEKANG